jgi:hypothetical protein
MKRLLFLSLLSVCLFGQNSQTQSQGPRFSATTGKLTLSGSPTTFTIQQATSGSKKIIFETANVYCSVACEVTQSQNGTAATTTSNPVLNIQPTGPNATATSWTSSNVGTGTAVGGVLEVPAAGVAVLDLSKIYFANKSTSTTNYSVTINGISGIVIITFYWSEI